MTRTMRTAVAAAAVLAAAVLVNGTVHAGAPAASCCACVELSGASVPPLQAFFCGYFPREERDAAEARCDTYSTVTSDPGLVCNGASATNCTAALAAQNISCPAPVGASSASSGMLAALIVLLGTAGLLRARRG